MARILLVEDAPDLGTYEAKILEARGHRVLWCCGGPPGLAACPMLRTGSCVLPESAEVIVFSCALLPQMHGHSYRGSHLLRAYREHPVYSRKPMLVVSIGAPTDLPGTGPLRFIDKHADPDAVLKAIDELLGGAALRLDVAPIQGREPVPASR